MTAENVGRSQKGRVLPATIDDFLNCELTDLPGAFEPSLQTICQSLGPGGPTGLSFNITNDESLSIQMSFERELKSYSGLLFQKKEVLAFREMENGLGSYCSICSVRNCHHDMASRIYLWAALNPKALAIAEFSEWHASTAGFRSYVNTRRLQREVREIELRRIQTLELRAVYFGPSALDPTSPTGKFLQDIAGPRQSKEVAQYFQPLETRLEDTALRERKEQFKNWKHPGVFDWWQERVFGWRDVNHSDELSRLAASLWYEFSDGAVISLRTILADPHSLVIPPALLPLTAQQQRALAIRSVYPLSGTALQMQKTIEVRKKIGINEDVLRAIDWRREGRSFEFESFSRYMTQIVESAIFLAGDGKLNLFFTTGFSHNDSRVMQIDGACSPGFTWHCALADGDRYVSELALTAKLRTTEEEKGRGSNWLFAPQFALNLAEKKVCLNAGWQMLFESEAELDVELVDRGFSDGYPFLAFKPMTQPLLADVVARLEKGTQVRFQSEPVEFKPKLRMQLSENHLMALARDVDHAGANSGGSFRIWNLGEFGLQLLDGLQGGLAAYSGSSPADLASRRFRDGDLRLLKHLGLFQLLVFDGAAARIKGVSNDGQPVTTSQELLALFETRVGSILELQQPLQSVVSRGVYKCLKDLADAIWSKKEFATIFYSGGRSLVEIVEGDLKFLFVLLTFVARLSGGACFRKARSAILSEVWNPVEMRLAKLKVTRVGPPTPVDSRVRALFDLKATTQGLKAGAKGLDLLELVPVASQLGFTIEVDGIELSRLSKEEFSAQFQLTERSIRTDGLSQAGPLDWFELNPKVFLRGREISVDEVDLQAERGLMLYRGQLYIIPESQIPSVRRLERFWQKLQSKGGVGTSSAGRLGQVRKLPRHASLELLMLRASGVAIEGGEDWKEICAFFDSLDQPRLGLRFGSDFKAELKPFQDAGVQWLMDLYKLRMGAVLADDMGLGKTLQTLGFLELLRLKKSLGRTLIIVPTSLTYNWVSEAKKFSPKLTIVPFDSQSQTELSQHLSSGEDFILLSTYGLMIEHAEFFKQYSWNVVVFDEAHNLKNRSTKRTSVACELKAVFKLCLTGTPLENHFSDFYSLIDLVVPGGLGEQSEFSSRYVRSKEITKDDVDELRLKTKPLVLRRTKEAVLKELPPRIENKVVMPFDPKQLKIYRDIAFAYNTEIGNSISEVGEAKCQLKMLTALLRLRQVCSDPSALPNVTYSAVPPKVSQVVESLDEIIGAGHSALVFTQFIQTLGRVVTECEAANLPVFAIHGAVGRAQREAILNAFEKCERGAVLVMTMKTGGVGLNLTKASYVFHLEPWWNPAAEDQATDRAHRLGQRRAVQVTRYIMADSVEERIEILKDRKRSRFDALFADVEGPSDFDGQPSGRLTQEDFKYLIKC